MTCEICRTNNTRVRRFLADVVAMRCSTDLLCSKVATHKHESNGLMYLKTPEIYDKKPAAL